MGHIINPVSTRLGLNIFWNSQWVLNNKYNYNRMFSINLYCSKFFEWVLKSKLITQKYRGLVYSHYSLYINFNNSIYINLYSYQPVIKKSKQAGSFPRLRYRLFKGRMTPKRWKLKQLYLKAVKNLLNLIIPKLYWYCIGGLINKYFNYQNLSLLFSFKQIRLASISPEIITNYVALRLIKRHALAYTIRPILRDLYVRVNQGRLKGYKILCVGRFTRRQIAEKNWYKEGPVPNNSFSNLIKYHQLNVRLKYGVCGIKVWLNFGSKIHMIPAMSEFNYFKNYWFSQLSNQNLFLINFKTSAFNFNLFRYTEYKTVLWSYKYYITEQLYFIIYSQIFELFKFEINLLSKKRFITKNATFVMLLSQLASFYLLSISCTGPSLIIKPLLNKKKLNHCLFIYE